jgi:hypothetical protein
VFDPNLLADYANDPGYLARMAEESPNPARSGYLFVNIIGGGSWVSEFEVLCGADHRVFEDGGSFPHMYLAGYLRSCFPAHLKRLGYETHAIYTTHPFFAGVGAGFRSYGIDRFESPSSIGAPLAWKDQRDEHFVAAMRRVLEQPRTKPRFIFLSTNSNHGPHGDGSSRPHFEGPFDAGRASDPALRDYINRLNDTYTTMLRLEREARASGRRLAILFYGDHQPSFRMNFVRSAPRMFGIRPHFVTLYRMVRTYGDPAGTQASGPLRIEDVTGEFLDFAGVPNSSAAALSRALTAKACPAGQAHCDGDAKRMIRHLLMRGS